MILIVFCFDIAYMVGRCILLLHLPLIPCIRFSLRFVAIWYCAITHSHPNKVVAMIDLLNWNYWILKCFTQNEFQFLSLTKPMNSDMNEICVTFLWHVISDLFTHTFLFHGAICLAFAAFYPLIISFNRGGKNIFDGDHAITQNLLMYRLSFALVLHRVRVYTR